MNNQNKRIDMKDLYYIDGQNLPLGADTPNLPKSVADYVAAMDEKIDWEYLHLDTPFYYDCFRDLNGIIQPYCSSKNKYNQN